MQTADNLTDLQPDGGGVRAVNPIGSTLQQRYRILEQLGSDGLVTTYIAIDLQVPGNLQLKCALQQYRLADGTPDSYTWERAALSAQLIYELSRQVDQLPTVYGYFAEGDSLYLVREFILGCPLAQELLADRPWSASRVVMLLADLLEVLHDIDSGEVIPDPVALSQIVRRTLDRKLVLINFPIATGFPRQPTIDDLSPTQHNLRTVGELAVAASMGLTSTELPLSNDLRQQWTEFAPKLRQPELVTILDRLISIEPEPRYPSTAAAWQAVAGVMSQLLTRHHTPVDTQAAISHHVRLLLDRGTGFYEIGNCHQAIEAYEQALTLNDRCVEAYCGRGNARRFLGDYVGSWDDFERAVALDPRNGVAYIGRALATCFRAPGNPQANADFQQGKSLLAQPQNAIEYVMRGTAQAQLQDSTGAIADYTTAIELHPRLVLAYNNRGNLRQHLGDWDGAIADFSIVLEIDPHSAIAYNNRAIVYAHRSRYPEAIADYTQAIELQPDFASAYNNRGNAYSNLGRYTEAMADYNHAIEFQPDFAVAYSNRGNIHRILEDLPTALIEYDLAISLDPNLTIAYYNRGICQRQSGQHELAIADYTQTLTLDPQYFYAYYHRANARQYLGDKRGAIADYTQTIRFDPNHNNAYYNRAVVRSEIGDLQGAMEDVDRAIEIQPLLPEAYYQRGRLLSTTGNHQLALTQYQQAIVLKPDYLDAHYQQGVSRQTLGDSSGALADFDRILAIDPNYAPAYYQRGKVNEQIGDLTGAVADYHKAAHLYLDVGDSQTYQQILGIVDRLVGGRS
jgi:tetratricopeptide (TPR) repeat protein